MGENKSSGLRDPYQNNASVHQRRFTVCVIVMLRLRVFTVKKMSQTVNHGGNFENSYNFSNIEPEFQCNKRTDECHALLLLLCHVCGTTNLNGHYFYNID